MNTFLHAIEVLVLAVLLSSVLALAVGTFLEELGAE